MKWYSELKRLYDVNIGKPWFIILIILAVTYSLTHFYDFYQNTELFSFNPSDKKGQSDQKAMEYYVAMHASLLIVLTLILACIAWIQLSSLNKVSRADYLLRITQQYTSKNILKARQELHKIYLTSDMKFSRENKKKFDDNLSENIKNLYEDKNKSDTFILILNFLEFLESVSYCANRGYITKDDVREMLGGSICYFFGMYIPLIKYLRDIYSDKQYYYKELEDFVRITNPNFYNEISRRL